MQIQINKHHKKYFKDANRGLYGYEPEVVEELIRRGHLTLSLEEECILYLWGASWECPPEVWRPAVSKGWVAIALSVNDQRKNGANALGHYITQAGKQARKKLYKKIRYLVSKAV